MNRPKDLGITALLSTLLWLGCADPPSVIAPDLLSAVAAGSNVVLVAPPAGNPAVDRASIQAALDAAGPGGTIQFAAGTYEIGLAEPFSGIEIPVPGLALLGHPDGTTLRGCAPAEIAFALCEGLWLNGGGQTIRRIEFVDMSTAIMLEPGDASRGGYRIEYNTFRNSMEGIFLFGQLAQPAAVRSNTFTNVGTAVLIAGSPMHVLSNQISAPDAELIPVFAEGFAGVLGLAFDLAGTGPCDHNVIAGNRIVGYRWGAGVEVIAGESCSHNMIRDNIILDSRIFAGFALGAPLFVWNESDQEELMEHNLVQGNHVLGAEGVGLVVLRASQTHVVNNSFLKIGSSPDGAWLGSADGAGVWVSPGSTRNRVLGNSFADIASWAVVLGGDRNHVATTSPSHGVLDLGNDNRVTGPGSVASQVVAAHAFGSSAAAAVAPTGAPPMAGRHRTDGMRWEMQQRRDRVTSRH
jgi:hypothetical protein